MSQTAFARNFIDDNTSNLLLYDIFALLYKSLSDEVKSVKYFVITLSAGHLRSTVERRSLSNQRKISTDSTFLRFQSSSTKGWRTRVCFQKIFESSISRWIALHTQHLDHVVVETKRRPPAEQSLRVRSTESAQTYTCLKEMYTRSLHSQVVVNKNSESNQKHPKSNYRQNRLESSSRQSPRLPTHFPRKASAMNGDDACQRASSSVGQRSLSYQIHLGSSSPYPSKKLPDLPRDDRELVEDGTCRARTRALKSGTKISLYVDADLHDERYDPEQFTH